jgi:polyhydroxyalkanoate synthesis regulator phasin
MKKIKESHIAAMVVVLAGIIFTFVLAAAAADHPVEQRVANQQKRIDEAVKSKTLTQAEAKILKDNLNYIKQEEKRLKADGRLGSKESERLDSMLEQNGSMIRDKKANPVKSLAPAPAAPAKAAAAPPAPAKPAAASTAPVPGPVPGSKAVDERFERQEKRIADGVKSGKLTQAEAKALRDNLSYIRTEESRLKADGKLNDKEKERLNKKLDQNSKMIEDKKNNPVKALKD